jgi:DNA-binding transcriptional LysR family regulator
VILTVVDDHLQRLLPRLEARELDKTPLIEDTFRAVLPAGHRLARRRRALDLTDLAGEPWIGGAPSSAWFRIVNHTCAASGFTPQLGFASDDYLAVQAFVAAGLGVAVIPGLAIAHPRPGVEVRELGNAPVRRISVARSPDGYRGASVSAMLDSLRAVARSSSWRGSSPSGHT